MWKMLWVAALALLLVGCDLGDEDSQTVKIQVAAHQVTCTGITQQRCYQVRFTDGAPWQLYYGDFKGFDFQPGFQYWLEVRQQHATQQDNPEHSRLEWELVKEISRTPVAATSADAAAVVPGAVPDAQGATPDMPATAAPATTGMQPATDDGAPSSAPVPTDDDIPPD